MAKTGIFYGSTTGNTEQAARAIADALGVDGSDVINVGEASADQLRNYDLLILGSSTWGIGDLQDDWESIIDEVRGEDLSGKKVAVFGTGDSASYSDSFCDAVGILAEAAEAAGAGLVGTGVDTSGYSYDESKAERDGTFVGLLLDYDNEEDRSEERISGWVQRIKTECGL